MAITYKVVTRDVDGSSSRTFKTFAAARKRFEEMVGYTMEQVMSEYEVTCKAEDLKSLYGVSMFGTTVSFSKIETDD